MMITTEPFWLLIATTSSMIKWHLEKHASNDTTQKQAAQQKILPSARAWKFCCEMKLKAYISGYTHATKIYFTWLES